MLKIRVLESKLSEGLTFAEGGKYDGSVMDLNNRHVVPILLTAFLQAFDMISARDNFVINNVTSQMYATLLNDRQYQSLVSALKEGNFKDVFEEETFISLPIYYVYDPRSGQYSVIHQEVSKYVNTAFVPKEHGATVYGKDAVFEINIVPFGKDIFQTIYFPVYKGENGDLVTFSSFNNIEKVRDIRRNLVNHFYRLAPFRIGNLPILGSDIPALKKFSSSGKKATTHNGKTISSPEDARNAIGIVLKEDFLRKIKK